MTPRMQLVDTLKIFAAHRRDDHIVVSTMGAAREWMKQGTHPLDFIYAPSAMGEAPALGLGLALARPEKKVIVLNGDGCLLMNLGCLVTITAEAPPNFLLAIFDNSVYEVTGHQWTAAASTARRGDFPVNYCQIALGCGFKAVYEFDRIDAWRNRSAEVLAARGPVFVLLKVAPVPGGEVPKSPAPPAERARAFAAALKTYPGQGQTP
jgi:thiamine pyrophosphate-dependent acetolactate synthase large subunit-like protein